MRSTSPPRFSTRFRTSFTSRRPSTPTTPTFWPQLGKDWTLWRRAAKEESHSRSMLPTAKSLDSSSIMISQLSRLEVGRNNQAKLHQLPYAANVLIPQFVDSLILTLVLSHSPAESPNQCVSENDAGLFDRLWRIELLLSYAVLKVHDLHA